MPRFQKTRTGQPANVMNSCVTGCAAVGRCSVIQPAEMQLYHSNMYLLYLIVRLTVGTSAAELAAATRNNRCTVYCSMITVNEYMHRVLYIANELIVET
jgi:hypothetical protein